ncbi:MAG: MG2 domain-containing protein, partial [Chthoniobacteraceae bacterium]
TVLLTAEQVGELTPETPRPGAQAIVQVTDLAAVWKRAAQQTFVHVFSMLSGKGVAGASLRLLDNKDAPLASAKTDAHGLAQLPPAAEARWLEVKTDSDQHLIEIKNGSFGINLARVNVDFDEDSGPAAANAMRAYLFTERGVYKPGETVHLKGIARDCAVGDAHVTPGRKGRLVAQDARGREFINREITLSDFGSFAEDLKLPKNAVGSFFVQVRFGASRDDERTAGSHTFQVQDYRPNAFEIAIGQAPMAPGPVAISLPIAAKYYMGKPLSKARLTWSIDARDMPFSSDEFRDFDFNQAIDNYRLNRELDRLSQFSQQGQADLDDKGTASLEIALPLNAKAPQPRSVRVLCEITDINQQTVSETRSFTQHSSDFYLGLRRFRSLVHENETLSLEIIAVQTDGTPMPEPVEAKLQLTRIDWQTNRVQTAGGATSYENEPRFELVTRRDIRTSPLAKEGRRWIASPLPEALSVEQPGQYLLEVSADDAAGRQVVTATTFQVYGAGATAWDYRNPYQIELVPDKDEYAAGETAKILIKTPITGDALVTIEREKVLRSFITHLEGNAPAITVPLEADDAPNVFISVMLLRGAADSPRKVAAPEYRIGYCELAVALPDSKLTVYVRPEATAYRPADEVTVNAEVLDFVGHPVAGAEVTLYAVDEGVLSLTGYETPNPLSFFNRRRSLAVSTSLTLPTLLDEDPELRGYENKGFLVGGGGDGNDGLRKNFLACAFWAADLITDETGKLTARFPAPDSLTRYRVIAVVQSRQQQFGAGESAFEVNKPVMIEPSLPRFANVGDRLALRAVVHNTTDISGTATISLALDDKAHGDETTRTIALPAHGSVALDFPVEFIEMGKATWKWTADFTGADEVKFGDRVQSELKVGFPAPLLREVRVFKNRSLEPNVLADVDPRILEGSGIVRVSLANSRAIEIQEALRQLLHYPYGCVEQTTSSTLPWLTLRDFQNLLPSLQRNDEEIAEAVQHGVDRLLSMQTAAGGLAYWPGANEPMLWGSAYGSIALTLARQQGKAAVPDEDYDRLMKWMSSELRGTASLTRHYDLSPRCLAVYALALAGRAEPAYGQMLFERRQDLAGDDRAL